MRYGELTNCVKRIQFEWWFEGGMMAQVPKTVDGPIVRSPAQTRGCPRYPLSSSIVAVDVAASTVISGRISDIARHGCYMDTISPFAPHATAKLTITRNDQSFTTQALVVYSLVGMGMGLLFTAAEPEQLRRLESWLGELASGIRNDPATSTTLSQPESGITFSAGHEMREILSELITLLKTKNIIDDSETKVMLRRLSR
jgi:hypothetical protein